eukprot:7131037-Prymnesium_polylepis.1
MALTRSTAPLTSAVHDGYCGETLDGEINDCSRDSFGSLGPLQPAHLVNWSTAWSVCAARCLGCARCRYLTVSLQHADCSWYARCDLKSIRRKPTGFLSRRVRWSKLPPEPPAPPLHEPARSDDDGAAPSCSIYVHDPGGRYNTQPMGMPGQRWSDTDHNWHVAYWLHRALLRYARRAESAADADVVFLAHYFLTENPVGAPLDFGAPLLGWDETLKRGPEELLRNDSVLLARWAAAPADFVAAPIL